MCKYNVSVVQSVCCHHYQEHCSRIHQDNNQRICVSFFVNNTADILSGGRRHVKRSHRRRKFPRAFLSVCGASGWGGKWVKKKKKCHIKQFHVCQRSWGSAWIQGRAVCVPSNLIGKIRAHNAAYCWSVGWYIVWFFCLIHNFWQLSVRD